MVVVVVVVVVFVVVVVVVFRVPLTRCVWPHMSLVQELHDKNVAV